MLREFLCPSVSLKIPQNSGVCVSVRVSLCEGQRLMQAVKRTVIIRKKHDRFCPSRKRENTFPECQKEPIPEENHDFRPQTTCV